MNYMKQVAEMLGVEVDEEFMFDGRIYCGKAKFNVYGIEVATIYDKANRDLQIFDSSSAILHGLLNGTFSVIKKPWKPETGETYWLVDTFVRRPAEIGISETYWDESFGDVERFRLGNCYRTKEEAKANLEKWKRFYESDERIDWE